MNTGRGGGGEEKERDIRSWGVSSSSSPPSSSPSFFIFFIQVETWTVRWWMIAYLSVCLSHQKQGRNDTGMDCKRERERNRKVGWCSKGVMRLWCQGGEEVPGKVASYREFPRRLFITMVVVVVVGRASSQEGRGRSKVIIIKTTTLHLKLS